MMVMVIVSLACFVAGYAAGVFGARETLKEMDADYRALDAEHRALYQEREKLRGALVASRGQWIHSVNAERCLKALGPGAGYLCVAPGCPGTHASKHEVCTAPRRQSQALAVAQALPVIKVGRKPRA